MQVLTAHQAGTSRTSNNMCSRTVLNAGSGHAFVDELPSLLSSKVVWRKAERHCEELANIDKGNLNTFTYYFVDEGDSRSWAARLWPANKKEAIQARRSDLGCCMVHIVEAELLIFDFSDVLKLLGQIDINVEHLARGRTGLIDWMYLNLEVPPLAASKDVESQPSKDCARLALVGMSNNGSGEPCKNLVQGSITMMFRGLSYQRLPLHRVVNCVLKCYSCVRLTRESAEDINALLENNTVGASSDSILSCQCSVAGRLVKEWLVGAPQLPCKLIGGTIKVDDHFVAEGTRVKGSYKIRASLQRKPVRCSIGGLGQQIGEEHIPIGQVPTKYHIGNGLMFWVLRGVTRGFARRDCGCQHCARLFVIDAGLAQKIYSPIVCKLGTLPERYEAVKVYLWVCPTRSIKMMGVTQ